MNPYLERREIWTDFHDAYIPALRNALARQVAPNYYVKLEEHVYIHELSVEERTHAGRPDLSVLPVHANNSSGMIATLAAPMEVRVPSSVDFISIPYLEVRDRRNHEIVTVIELLSPSNKTPGADREQHEYKWRLLLGSPANLVELDLLRGGTRMPWVDAPQCDYCIAVSRTVRRPQVDFWPISLRDPLPTIPIPLRPADSGPTLDLKAILDQVHDEAKYPLFLYDGDPEPRLGNIDLAWASSIARSIGLQN